MNNVQKLVQSYIIYMHELIFSLTKLGYRHIILSVNKKLFESNQHLGIHYMYGHHLLISILLHVFLVLWVSPRARSTVGFVCN